MPNLNFSNSWTKEVQIKVWVPEPDVVKNVTLSVILQCHFLLLQALFLLSKLFTFFSQFVIYLLNELPRVIQLTPNPLKIGLQLIKLCLSDGVGLLDLHSQLFLTLCPSNELSSCFRELIAQLSLLFLVTLSLKHILVRKTSELIYI
ncbi:hypothetical protein ACOSQ2_032191 [Xanthoceras sorbifolium]